MWSTVMGRFLQFNSLTASRQVDSLQSHLLDVSVWELLARVLAVLVRVVAERGWGEGGQVCCMSDGRWVC
jgi:hypothetical protein